MTQAVLTLEDGTIFKGNSIGSDGSSIGEVVFNTAMTGYQEILTDPSYYKQIVTLTYPHIGNTGTNLEDFESKKTYLSGLVIRESSPISSNWRNETDLQNFLCKEKVIAIADIDTRKLTNHLRKNGSMKGCISTDYKNVNKCIDLAQSFSGLSGLDLAKEVSVKESYLFNQKGRKRLIEAFEKVNRKFNEVYTKLFNGGNAKLELVDSDDPLEAGLEMLVSPPGKRLQSITLLSGGEQALTALSLIFAVFLTNPSPICVLDEVDAPLDDANVTRFCNLLEELIKITNTKFIIVTHHALTMSKMNRLYGVTMPEKGISQLVAVDLQKAESMVA